MGIHSRDGGPIPPTELKKKRAKLAQRRADNALMLENLKRAVDLIAAEEEVLAEDYRAALSSRTPRDLEQWVRPFFERGAVNELIGNGFTDSIISTDNMGPLGFASLREACLLFEHLLKVAWRELVEIEAVFFEVSPGKLKAGQERYSQLKVTFRAVRPSAEEKPQETMDDRLPGWRVAG